MVICIAVVLGCYLIGAVSFGAILGRFYHVDVFHEGSGTPGATNIHRLLGKTVGELVFIFDFLKGFLPSWIILHAAPTAGDYHLKLAVAGLIAVLLGHSFSIFHHFRGGKGVASTMGGVLAIMPRTLVIGLLVWVVIFHATRIVSFASLMFVLSLLLTSYLFGYPKVCILLALILNIIIFVRHKDNLVRLMRGTEYKFTRKSK